jgi:two-component system cell cycle response regulator
MDKNETLQTVLHSEQLPTLPVMASKLITLMSREETTLADIARLISRDVALSAKILRVSNSAFYSFPQQISSIQQAVSVLGINAVRSLVLSFSFLNSGRGEYQNSFDFKTFWKHSLAAGVASRLLVEKIKGVEPEEVFVSGLLQNLGELILARTLPIPYEQIIRTDIDATTDRLQVEETILGVNHCSVGSEVAKHWGFPESLFLPIGFHHKPEQYDGKNKTITKTIRAVYLSDLLINILYSEQPEHYHKRFRKESKKLLCLSSDDIENVLDRLHLLVSEAGDYFGLKIKTTRSIQEILQEANIRLSLINLDYEQVNKQLVAAKLKLEKLTTELQSKNKILDNLANVDGLTDVFNHRYFQNVLDQEIERAARNNTFLSLLFIDIDHFKKFNDAYGHQVGDFILREFCTALKRNIRSYDTLARYGGEEFAIILPSTAEEESLAVAEKLRKLIEDTVFAETDGTAEYRVTASIGVCTEIPADVENFSKDLFISKADQALYEAKKQGRNLVTSWSPKKKWFTF